MFLYKLFENWGQKEFEQHFKDVQKFYREKRDTILIMVEKHLNGILLFILKGFIITRNLKIICLKIFIR